MAFTIIGKVHSVGQTQNIATKAGGNLQKRELVLDASRADEYTGEVRSNFPVFTFMSKNCERLDGLRKGDLIEVSFVLQGRQYVRDGVTKHINDVVGFKVEPRGSSAQVAAPAPAPAATNTQVVGTPTSEENLPF